MEAFFKYFAQSKIPTLILIALVLIVGGYIVVNSKSDVKVFWVGVSVLGVGGILALIAFGDYSHKEYIDSIIQHYDKALKSISTTHTLVEENKQETFKHIPEDVGSGEEKYSVETESKTTAS